MNYKTAVKHVMSRGFGVRADLDRISALTELLGHPERSYPTIHLAGTNGKSTTARMIGAILAAHGLKAGVYTSPHLQSIRERFAVVGVSDQGFRSELISQEAFAEAVEYLARFVEIVENEKGQQVTYFELTTALGFEWMLQIPVDVGVFEAGMGGAWDATNLITPSVGVLTHIAVDHHRYLGVTAQENAREKVGIIKPGMAVVSADQGPDVQEVIESKAAEVGTALRTLGRDFAIVADGLALGGRSVSVNGLFQSYEELQLPLHGAHQSRNLAVAVAACESFLDRPLDDASLRGGLAIVESPGRLEVVGRDPLIVLDGAHNPDGAQNLATALIESFGDRRRTLVVSISQGKDVEGILEALVPVGDRIIFTAHKSYPSEDPQLLAKSSSAINLESDVITDLAEAVAEAVRSSLDDDMVVVAGSLYAVGEARDVLVGKVP